jgi:hypothetical protein
MIYGKQTAIRLTNREMQFLTRRARRNGRTNSAELRALLNEAMEAAGVPQWRGNAANERISNG